MTEEQVAINIVPTNGINADDIDYMGDYLDVRFSMASTHQFSVEYRHVQRILVPATPELTLLSIGQTISHDGKTHEIVGMNWDFRRVVDDDHIVLNYFVAPAKFGNPYIIGAPE